MIKLAKSIAISERQRIKERCSKSTYANNVTSLKFALTSSLNWLLLGAMVVSITGLFAMHKHILIGEIIFFVLMALVPGMAWLNGKAIKRKMEGEIWAKN